MSSVNYSYQIVAEKSYRIGREHANWLFKSLMPGFLIIVVYLLR